jgi:hypothetical protein
MVYHEVCWGESRINVEMVYDISVILCDMSDTNSKLTWLTAWEGFIIYCYQGGIKPFKVH